MSTISTVQVMKSNIKNLIGTNDYWISVKGAPEVLKSRLVNVPPQFEETYKSYARNGSRVLCIGKLLNI